MALDESIIREVDEEIAEEQMAQEFKKNLPWVLALVIGVLGFVGAREYYETQRTNTAETTAIQYSEAVATAAENPAAGQVLFDQIATEGPAGYAALAKMQKAAYLADNDDREKAIALFLEIAGDSKLPKRTQSLGRLKAAFLATDDGYDKVAETLNGLETEETPLGSHAREIMAIAALGEKKFSEAVTLFDQIIAMPNASAAVQARANDMRALADLGAQGVDIPLNTEAAENGLSDLFAAPSTIVSAPELATEVENATEDLKPAE